MSAPIWTKACMALAVAALFVSLAAFGASPEPASAQVASQSGASSFGWFGGYTVVQHRLPEPNSQPWAIAADPLGNLWFVEQGTNMLGEYHPATGNFSQYPIPTARSSPDAVAADRYGNIWFVELTSNKLGELPANRPGIVEFPIPGSVVTLGTTTQTLGCGPGAVVAAPSGDIWIACLFSNQIAEFIPAQGTFLSYDLPVFQSAPAGMVLDGSGNLWFTAADSNMLGKAVVSQLRNGTSQGITEFAPMNQTYQFEFTHPTSFLGSTEVISSSFRTPSGIALSPSGKLWFTEHVDSSFDSYDPAGQSLVKYWTTQTHGANGYSVTFPNGIAVDANGSVWIGEHYGNRVAEFLPSSGVMTEYPVPCCTTGIAGVYSVTLAPDGRLWFVEIGGDAIGEMVPAANPLSLSLKLPSTTLTMGAGQRLTVPLSYAQKGMNATPLSLSVSGITIEGTLQNMTATFSAPMIALPPEGSSVSNLTLSLAGLSPGVYYLTLGATAQDGVIYSAILELTVEPGGTYPILLYSLVVACSIAAAGAVGLTLVRRSRPGRPRMRSFQRSLTSTATSAAH
ncbi:MAG: SMP-30/gluconolactonase/LRE family protein [Nitrososphaerota archaeon]|nr:SMP-30/gluconolactonase/LRE family protein [Nitrososphaerota archaeon]